MERILKPVLFTEDRLAPSRIALFSENPPLVVLCFDDEDAEPTDDNMIELCRAVGCGDNQVVNAVVDRIVEVNPESEGRSFLAKPAFEKIEHDSSYVLIAD